MSSIVTDKAVGNRQLVGAETGAPVPRHPAGSVAKLRRAHFERRAVEPGGSQQRDVLIGVDEQ